VTSRIWVRAMGGDLRVRSDVDRGSVFTLKLPRA
jgi:signal transduction histidine kinase